MPESDRGRTATAIALAVAAGVPIGLLLTVCAVPFGPVLVGWFVALAAAVVVPAGLCVLATRRYLLVGMGYAAGVASTVVIASIVTSGFPMAWWIPALQFGAVFVVVALVSSFSCGLCALLKCEDARARREEASNAEQVAAADRPREERPVRVMLVTSA